MKDMYLKRFMTNKVNDSTMIDNVVGERDGFEKKVFCNRGQYINN